MSTERKALKIICFLYVLDAIFYAIVGAFTLDGVAVLDPSGTVSLGGVEFALVPWAVAFGAWFVLSAVFYLVLATLGIRGANTPRKIGAFKGMVVGSLVVGIVGAVRSAALHGPASGQSAIPYVSIALTVASIYLAGKIQRQAER